ncbi:response regulator [Hahella aquimaris]|uniref:response regulator n=1 Tax=Hahella sp. HNIBRBA332 TaxID=3015983 RepID=UPI00273CCDD2|nr:response regulator [Hahella sp. HNIBRBA332]WLQ16729.1 response regulator [Hahella sp. HNIBRBA332]
MAGARLSDTSALHMRTLLAVVLAFGALAIPFYYLAYSYQLDQEYRNYDLRLAEQTDLRAEAVLGKLDLFRRDVRFLSNTPPIQGIVRAIRNNDFDPQEGNTLWVWKKRLQVIFSEFMKENPRFAQVRYIGVANAGREIVRVDRTQEGVVTAQEQQLQIKEGRDYFQATLKQAAGEVYVSDITLNREQNNQLETPHRPVIRVSVPIYEEGGVLFGMVVINVEFAEILNELAADVASEYSTYLLNSDGDFLVHPDRNKVFGFDIGERYRWSDLFRLSEAYDSYERMKAFQGPHGLIHAVMSNIPLDQRDPSRRLTLVKAVSDDFLAERAAQTGKVVIAAVLVAVAVLGVVLYLFMLNLRRRIQINREQARLAAIVDGSTDAIISKSLEGVVISWNQAAEKMFGYTSEEAVGRTMVSLIMPESRLAEEEYILQRLRRGDPVSHFDTTRKRRDGSEFDVSVTVSPVRGANGAVLGAATTIRDITAQKAIEKQVNELNANLEQQVRQRTEELKKAKDVAEAASMAKSEFVANMSHEIRTPMNAILGMLQLLQRTVLTNRQHDYADKLEAAARTLLSILNDILDFSKVEAGKLSLDLHPFNIDQVFREVGVIMSANLGGKPVELLFDIDPEIPYDMLGDGLRLKQVLINLVGNAVKFTDAGEIVLSAKLLQRKDRELELFFSVRDTGIGISPENLQNIFDGFSQAEASTSRRFGGTGLGLAICRRLVNLMKGQMSVDSTPGSGSTFKFTVKMGVVDGVQGPRRSIPNLHKLNVLVVDDNETAREIVAGMAQGFGWRTDLAASGAEAIAYMEASRDSGRPYDVVFVDYLMPTDSGLDVCRKIRAMDFGDVRPILVMMSAQGREILERHSQSGDETMLDSFIVKPITASILLDSVADARAAGRHGSISYHWRSSGQMLKGLKLLVVEDNPTNQQVALELLGSEGAQVEVASNGAECVEMVKRGQPPYDLVLMDIQMPVMDGYCATREIRNRLGLTELPIIAMTANAMSSDREACLSVGMNDHVGKPFELGQLVEVILKQTGLECRLQQVTPLHTSESLFTHDELQLANSLQIDVAAALARFGGSLTTYRTALSGYRKEVLALLDRWDAYFITQDDPEQMANGLHTLKGLAGSIGAAGQMNIIQDVEQALRSHELDDKLLAALRREMERTPQIVVAIDNILAPKQAAQLLPEADPRQERDLRCEFKELAALVRASNMEAISFFENLKRKYAAELPEAVDELEESINQLDFSSALALCYDMLKQLESSDYIGN